VEKNIIKNIIARNLNYEMQIVAKSLRSVDCFVKYSTQMLQKNNLLTGDA